MRFATFRRRDGVQVYELISTSRISEVILWTVADIQIPPSSHLAAFSVVTALGFAFFAIVTVLISYEHLRLRPWRTLELGTE